MHVNNTLKLLRSFISICGALVWLQGAEGGMWVEAKLHGK